MTANRLRVGELLQTTVVTADGERLGRVRDLHIVQDGPLRASGEHGFRVDGLVAGRFALATRLGYVTYPGITPDEETRGPLAVRAIVRWLHRNARYIPWEDIADITPSTIIVHTAEP
jgi:sporulation protein YlmC with PRC-barrel domain